MIAYKATHNFKCRNQEYRVGKTYTSDKLQICKHGFHFCLKMEDTLNYYTYDKNFVLLEIEILGKTEFGDDKGVTDKMRVIRVVSPEEYNEEMRKNITIYEYDERGNLISETFPNGEKWTFEYDDKGNKISETYPNGDKYTYEYDDKGNLISETFPNGDKFTSEYDDKGNKISETYPNGVKLTFEITQVTEE